MLGRVLAGGAAALSVVLLCSSPSAASAITVEDLGVILNNSVSFPDTKTPGSGKLFEDFFEFTLPQAEFVSASMSISGPMVDQIPAGDGRLILATWTSTGLSAPYVPSGAVIEEATVSAPSSGGQSAVVGTETAFGDFEPAGLYFVEVSGTSGAGSLKLAVDGNVTAAVPELSTWAMLGIGFAGVAAARLTKRRGDRERDRYAF